MRSAICLTAAVLLVGCGHQQATWPFPEDEEAWSILKTNATADDLNAIILRTDTSDDERRLAIQQLFANHIKPKMTSKEMGAIFKDAPWLATSSLTLQPRMVSTIFGSFGGEFVLDLAPPERDGAGTPPTSPPRSKWLIRFSLNGRGKQLNVEDARKYLTGAEGVPGGPDLIRFTIFLPGDVSAHFGRGYRRPEPTEGEPTE